MLISKTTWCFACKEGKLTRYLALNSAIGVVQAIDTCSHCPAEKKTIMEGEWAGIVGYKRNTK